MIRHLWVQQRLIQLTCLSAIKNSWRQQQKLTTQESDNDNFFGGSVALEGDVALIGAYRDDSSGVNAGAAYLFVRSVAEPWVQQEKLMAMDGMSNDQFGGRCCTR